MIIVIIFGILILMGIILGAWRLFESRMKKSMEQQGGVEGLATGIEGSSSDEDDRAGRGDWEEMAR